jgi:hypothetical protein
MVFRRLSNGRHFTGQEADSHSVDCTFLCGYRCSPSDLSWHEAVQKVGVLWDRPGSCNRELGMKWRVMLELVGPDGVVGVHEVGGRAVAAEYAPQTIGLTLAEGEHLLAALQVHLVRAQVEDHCRRRRRCQRCGEQRPLKDQRSRRLVSLFGTVTVRAPRFTPCRCAVTCRRTLNPVGEIMPDRCTPEYERTVAKMGSLLPYRRARTLLAEF